MPAVTPAELHTAPSHTKMGSISTRASGNCRASSAQSCQCVTARRPSSKPAAPSTKAPVHTEPTRRAWRARAANQLSNDASRATCATPRPPATSSVSTGVLGRGRRSASIARPDEVRTGLRAATSAVR